MRWLLKGVQGEPFDRQDGGGGLEGPVCEDGGNVVGDFC
jgi:hypothetical protein